MNANIVEFPHHAAITTRLTPDQEWEQIESLYKEVQDLLHEIGRWGRKEGRAQNFLRYRFNVSSHTELTIGDMRLAIPMLRNIATQCEKFSMRMHEISNAFDEEVVGHGAPWTPQIARKLGRRRMHQEGKNPNWDQLLTELKGEIGATR